VKLFSNFILLCYFLYLFCPKLKSATQYTKAKRQNPVMQLKITSR